MSDIKVSEMSEATELNNNDLMMVVQNGVNKKSKIENLGISELKTSLEEQINKIGTYSTEETDTGKKWINGKPIYRKVISINNNITNLRTYPHNITNIENVIKIEGTGVLGSGVFMELNHYILNDNIAYNSSLGIEGENIRFYLSNGRTLLSANVILEYTKTTDTID